MMKDELFGELSYDYLWEGKTKIKLYGTEYEVGLGINGEEEDGITELQKESFIFYKKKENDIYKEIEIAIYKYYKFTIFSLHSHNLQCISLSNHKCFHLFFVFFPIVLVYRHVYFSP